MSGSKVLVIGAAGYIGSAVAAAFAAAGHRVSGLQRPGGRPVPRAYRAVPGDLTDPPSLVAAVDGFDLVVHVGALRDDRYEQPGLRALLGTGTPMLYTSGVDVLGPGEVTEDSPPEPHPIVAWRAPSEIAVRAHGGRLIRPGLVYGNGGGVVHHMLAPMTARLGCGIFLGEPGVRWAAVHVEDLARLFVAVAERAAPGTAWNAVAETVRVDDIARAIGGGVARSLPVDQAPPEIHDIAGLFRYDQAVSAERTRREMSWQPVHESILDELGRWSPAARSDHALEGHR
ncbi:MULTISPECIES: NAD-dependent epimerase/dehydratase family protein [unclassified Solwaraspora]|uniref:NAD-dependent epimerase/dehydratase family protein n=1 Tax=unclassified Solwaraspora TaxID=2627926 RepID=UPI00259B38E9|nr:NAD-dependent epimerase/dehydratase family protein [Solwaraspora sp. WMMA2056]WJK38629.1 NAD-dependent epimerase/dehydratase family protein [Solwaraspora sp. WMMA2056]